MKHRYSPETRRAHLAHMRAKYGKSSVVSVQEVQPDPIKKLVEAYQGGFLTAVELADLILQTLPQPEAERVTATIEAAHQRALREQPKPEEDDDGLPLPATKHDEGCQCHLCWAASLTPPSPPWKGGAA